jgi:uncharacterized protein YbjQ (UPF0145 family)
MVKALRRLGSLSFLLGLFTVVFVGVPWAILVEDDPLVPLWLRAAVFGVLGGLLLVLLTVALEQGVDSKPGEVPRRASQDSRVLLLNSDAVPGRTVSEILGLVQGHTVFAIWLGNDLSALMRLILGGELTEYTDMMGRARELATDRMVARAEEKGADAIINVRYATTGVVGTASELLVYGTAVRLAA